MTYDFPHRGSIATLSVALLAAAWTAAPAVAQDCGLVKLFPSNPTTRLTFGNTVSISGDYFVVDGPRGGTAYVFRRTGGSWEEVQRLSRPQGSVGEASIDGGLILLGMRNSDPVVYRLEGETWVRDGVLGSASRSSASYGQFSAVGGAVAVVPERDSSTVHIFYRGADGWVEEETLRNVGNWNVATDGERALIGNPPGSADIFRRVSDGGGPGKWILEATLTASDGCGAFGSGVSIRGDLALVGSAPTFTGNPCGKAYVFRRSGEEWVEEQILEPQDIPASERFGRERAVSIDGDRAVLGAFADSQFEGGSGFGAAYVYRYDGSEWLLETRIAPPQSANDWFASSAAVEGGTVLVGAPNDATQASRGGAAYVLTLVPGLEAIASVAPEQSVVGGSVLFDGSASAVPDGMEIVSYTWDFGDGEMAEGMTVEHAYARAGRYEVVLRLVTADERCAQKKLRIQVLCEEEGVAPPWAAADVGEPAFPGSARFLEDGDTLEMCAGGAGILSGSDEFHFVYQEALGDVFLRARVDEFDANLRALTGVMMRASLDAAAPNASMLVENPLSPLSDSRRFRFKSRVLEGSTTRTGSGDSFSTFPAWVEIRREGSELIGLSSVDGENWTEVGRAGVELPEPFLVGFVLSGRDTDPESSFTAAAARFSGIEGSIAPAATRFRRGDPNADEDIDLSDGLFVLNFLFLGGVRPTCMKSADADDSNVLDLTDGVFIFVHLFLGGPPPPAPFESCGEDPTEDELTCESFLPCA